MKAECDVVANMLDYGIVGKWDQTPVTLLHIHFQTNTPWERHKPSYSLSYMFNSITAGLQVWLRH